MTGRAEAFSTGEAARYCYVTADTIVNWIRGGSLQAQRTFGGQYRIQVDDLREFMASHGMSTALLDAELDIRPYCWEFHGNGALDDRCRGCLAHRSGALNCFELCDLTDPAARRMPSCTECDYYRSYGLRGRDEV